jgi:antitoxin (DNA-binding transcriptional repressor) of toxin-antitoxin stability system
MSIDAHKSITATELVRNLSALIDKVRITRRSLLITKGSQTVAELSPPPKSGLPIEKLGELLAMLPKLGDDATAMEADIKTVRQQTPLPGNPWD